MRRTDAISAFDLPKDEMRSWVRRTFCGTKEPRGSEHHHGGDDDVQQPLFHLDCVAGKWVRADGKNLKYELVK
jgi:hypothetical protein